MNPKPALIAVFAHPDDEAMGPAGYLTKATKEYDVHVICVTNGALGKNDEGIELKHVRQRELMASASVLGIRKVHFLHFEDGCLCNSMYMDLAKKIGDLFDQHKPTVIVTFEPRGVSGHLDHIAITSVVTYLYERKDYIKTLLYYAFDFGIRSKVNDYFVYMPPGYHRDHFDLIVDIEDVWNTKVKAIRCHKSQKADGENVIGWMDDLPKEEHFLVLKK